MTSAFSDDSCLEGASRHAPSSFLEISFSSKDSGLVLGFLLLAKDLLALPEPC